LDQEYKVSCSCGHVFSLAYDLWCKTEIKCPACGEILVFEPMPEQEMEDEE